MTKTLLLFLLSITFSSFAQEKSFDKFLFDGYKDYKESTLSVRRVKHAQIQPLINAVRMNSDFQITTLGQSIEGRDISMLSIGEGEIDILLWSQMHGDEPTATLAIFDIINFLSSSTELKKEKQQMLKKVKLHFIPMLNPDGAELFKRRNALDIDINRDALRLQSPEGRILKSVRDSLDAEFGFNLHDQSKYYNAERTDKPATISYLAPAYNYEKEVNDVRGNAMKVIVLMNNIIQKYAPGQVGRYSDDFEPRAFGDNIQKWGTSAILIESGGYPNDPEKQFIRKLNYMSLLSAIFSISDGSYANISIEEYETIPNNDRKIFDLKIENLTYNLLGKDYIVDVGIFLYENDNDAHNDFHYVGKVAELGDLSTFYGYQTIDASGLKYAPSKVYPNKIDSEQALSKMDLSKLLSQGFTAVQLKSIESGRKHSKHPINLVKSKKTLDAELKLGADASFLLMEGSNIKYVIINGFVFDPAKVNYGIANGVIN